MNFKKALLAALVGELEAELETLRETVRKTVAGATHEEAKPENDKDTRALEQSYLARGQAARVEEVEEQVSRLRFVDVKDYAEGDAIGVGAVVEVAIDGEDAPWRAILLPVGGGLKTVYEGIEYRVVTAVAPFGRAILGKEEGDEFELKVARKVREYEILSVR